MLSAIADEVVLICEDPETHELTVAGRAQLTDLENSILAALNPADRAAFKIDTDAATGHGKTANGIGGTGGGNEPGGPGGPVIPVGSGRPPAYPGQT